MRRTSTLGCYLCLLTALFAFLLIGYAQPAHAAWPPDESSCNPADTNYAECLQDLYANANNWPSDSSYKDMWELWSFLPREVKNRSGVSAQNQRLGAGAWVDRAWAKTTGDRRVLISVLDSGANWSNDDLVNKWFLNRAELPAPDSGCEGGDGATYDRNGDGYFNVQDYTTATGHETPLWSTVCDSRVKAKGDVNGNNLLDPQDLIAAFSDGTDADGNGYIDDISGWDFFHNDNDPYDDNGFGHGNGEARDSASEGNNGKADIGTCPDCSVQLLRAGDSFVTDANMFGMAVTYAVDSGSSIVQEALGTITNTPFSKRAMDYAYENNVAIIASAADEDSFHHNFPGTNNHTFYVHAITYDAAGSFRNATTFLNYNNCTNYGAQLMASVPGTGCSSEATGKLSGMAGLLYSAALKADLAAPANGHAGDPDHNRRLTAEEVYQLLKLTADDLDDPNDATDPSKYPTKLGWEQRFGYGRINARAAVDAVLDGKLPPEVEIRDPMWFQVIHPDRNAKVTIDGRIHIERALSDDSFDWVLEYAKGIDPDNDVGGASWTKIGGGEMVSGAPHQGMDGPLADWDVSQLQVDNPTQGPPDNLTNRRAVTVRLRVTIHSTDPARDGQHGEARRAVFIERDPDLLSGFPINLGGSGEQSPKIVDLDGDGKRELVLGDAHGLVHAFEADGTELAGWPVKVNPIPGLDPDSDENHLAALAFQPKGEGGGGLDPDVRSSTAFSVAVGDLDGDGKREVVAATWDGYVYAWHADGSLVDGWPFSIDRSTRTHADKDHVTYEGILAAPALADFNGDGKLDVAVGTMNALLYVLGGDGQPLASWNGGQPKLLQDPTLSDSTDPRQIRDRVVSSPALGDLNGDGTPDIVLGTNENYDNSSRLYAVDGKTGAFLDGWPLHIVSNYILPFVGSGMPNAPAMADLDGDGVPEVIAGGIAGALRIYTAAGKPFKNDQFGGTFPNNNNNFGAQSNATNGTSIVLISNPSVGDLDDDGVLDVLMPTGGGDAAIAFATGGTRRDFEHHLDVWSSATGKFLPGFPQLMEDWQFFTNPSVADIDGDGRSEALAGSAGYWVHAFRADGTEPDGFPKLTGGWVAASVAVGDMDGDGKLEYAVTTRDGWLYAWHGGGSAGSDGRVDWASFHHDDRNTGNYDTPLDQGGKKGMAKPDAGTPDMGTGGGDGSGCSCAVGGHGGPNAGAAVGMGLTLLGLLGLLRAWRRRSRLR